MTDFDPPLPTPAAKPEETGKVSTRDALAAARVAVRGEPELETDEPEMTTRDALREARIAVRVSMMDGLSPEEARARAEIEIDREAVELFLQRHARVALQDIASIYFDDLSDMRIEARALGGWIRLKMVYEKQYKGFFGPIARFWDRLDRSSERGDTEEHLAFIEAITKIDSACHKLGIQSVATRAELEMLILNNAEAVDFLDLVKTEAATNYVADQVTDTLDAVRSELTRRTNIHTGEATRSGLARASVKWDAKMPG